MTILGASFTTSPGVFRQSAYFPSALPFETTLQLQIFLIRGVLGLLPWTFTPFRQRPFCCGAEKFMTPSSKFPLRRTLSFLFTEISGSFLNLLKSKETPPGENTSPDAPSAKEAVNIESKIFFIITMLRVAFLKDHQLSFTGLLRRQGCQKVVVSTEGVLLKAGSLFLEINCA